MDSAALFNYVFCFVTGVGGVAIFVGDALLAAPILYHDALRVRKEFLSIAALAVADSLNGLTCVSAGFSTLIWVMLDPTIETENNYGFTRLHCLLLPHNLLGTFFFTTSATLLPIVSLDRLLYAVAPLWYHGKGPRMAQVMIGVMFAHGIVYGIACTAYSVLYNDIVPLAICVQWDIMGAVLYEYQIIVYILGHLLSVVIFLLALLFYVRHNSKVVTGTGQLSASVQAQQRSLMLNVALSTLATFLLVILPLCLDLTIGQHIEPLALRLLLFYVINYVNPLINVYLFLINNRLMRRALQLMREGKQGPHNLHSWLQTPSVGSNKVVEVKVNE